MKLIIVGPVVAVLSAVGAMTDDAPQRQPTRVKAIPFEAAAFDRVIHRQVTGRFEDLNGIRNFSRAAVRSRYRFRHEYVRPPQDEQYVLFRVYRTDRARRGAERVVAEGRVDRRTMAVTLALPETPEAFHLVSRFAFGSADLRLR